MEPLGTLQVGDVAFRVVRVTPVKGMLRLEAHHPGPAELAVPRAEWFAPDGSLIYTIDPFRVSEEYATSARHPSTANVTVVQDVRFVKVGVVDEPSPVGWPV